MEQDVTNRVLLQHMQAMKVDLERKIDSLGHRVDGLQGRIDGVGVTLGDMESVMVRGFEDARVHRQALQEDLDASIRMLGKHDRKLARL